MLPLSQAFSLIDSWAGTPISEIPEDIIESIYQAQYSEYWHSLAFRYCPLCGQEPQVV